jgi:hypothetical protein
VGAAGLTVVTDESMIDKVAVGKEFTASDPLIFPPEKMSDHHAVSCRVQPSPEGGKKDELPDELGTSGAVSRIAAWQFFLKWTERSARSP